jgi:hypothetical protein
LRTRVRNVVKRLVVRGFFRDTCDRTRDTSHLDVHIVARRLPTGATWEHICKRIVVRCCFCRINFILFYLLGTKRHECTACGKSFALKSYLNKHQESVCSCDDQIIDDGMEDLQEILRNNNELEWLFWYLFLLKVVCSFVNVHLCVYLEQSYLNLKMFMFYIYALVWNCVFISSFNVYTF